MRACGEIAALQFERQWEACTLRLTGNGEGSEVHPACGMTAGRLESCLDVQSEFIAEVPMLFQNPLQLLNATWQPVTGNLGSTTILY